MVSFGILLKSFSEVFEEKCRSGWRKHKLKWFPMVPNGSQWFPTSGCTLQSCPIPKCPGSPGPKPKEEGSIGRSFAVSNHLGCFGGICRSSKFCKKEGTTPTNPPNQGSRFIKICLSSSDWLFESIWLFARSSINSILHDYFDVFTYFKMQNCMAHLFPNDFFQMQHSMVQSQNHQTATTLWLGLGGYLFWPSIRPSVHPSIHPSMFLQTLS